MTLLPAAPIAPPAATRITAPTLPVPPARQPFPVIATVAPVVMSVALWVMTQSVFALMFAALGPCVAVASLVDSRVGGRKRHRAEVARFEAELAETRHEVAEAHAREREALEAASPSARALVTGHEPARWGETARATLRLGVTSQPSRLSLEGTPALRGDEPARVALRRLREETVVVHDAPLAIAVASSIGVAGHPVAARALARSLLIQVLARLSPATYSTCGGEPWLNDAPHARDLSTRDCSDEIVEVSDGSVTVVIAVAREVAALPASIETVVRVDSTGAVLLGADVRFTPDFASTEEAALWVRAASAVAARSGLTRQRAAIPEIARYAELEAAAVDAPGGLACPVGLDASGQVTIDLVRDGPHAVVGGTTGSGKSELLITWLLSMANRYSPAQLNLLLFDFKGGSSFGSIASLPHTVGLVTDLDVAAARRATQSLAAELRFRERVLAAAAARSIEQCDALPRLVIAVDEFAAMAAELPELHAQFSDLAARGRSLGVHLIVCTQRPAGVVRDSVLANASLRLSLRVNNRADSEAVIGTADAASSRALLAGRAWLARAGSSPSALQVAIADDADATAAIEYWGSDWSPRRPWCEPLPALLALDELSLDEPGAIGLIDLPAEQSQPPLLWCPDTDGNLLVLGAARSGRTSALRAIAAQTDVARVPSDPEALWDAVESPSRLLLVDDLDLVLARMPLEYQQQFVERLGIVMRSPEVRIAFTAQRLSSSLQQLAALCDSRLLLRMPTRQEHIIAGGSGDDFDDTLGPGAGHWRGARVQLALAPPLSTTHAATSAPLLLGPLTIAVSTRASALAQRLEAAGFLVSSDPRQSRGVIVTDPDGWQAQWQVFTALAKQHPVLFHDCSLAEYRQLSRQRSMPPLIADTASTGWLLSPAGDVKRVTF